MNQFVKEDFLVRGLVIRDPRVRMFFETQSARSVMMGFKIYESPDGQKFLIEKGVKQRYPNGTPIIVFSIWSLSSRATFTKQWFYRER